MGSILSFRIDWFDESVTEDTRPSASAIEDIPATVRSTTATTQESKEAPKKAIGFRKLYEISRLDPPILNSELESRPGFWLLFSTDLSQDFIVLIVKTLKTLYKSLQKNDSSKLIYLLETKFMKSDFFKKLLDYVKQLPDVALSQKSRNSQLWDDVNCFYTDLLEFIKSIFNFYKNEKEYLEQLKKTVEIMESSARCVVKNHSEYISEKFYQDITNLQNDLKKALKDINETEHKILDTFVTDDVNNIPIQELSIIPNFCDYLDIELINNIKPNIVDGAYTSAEHYLDIQFKLFREDCYRPLKEGINQYTKDNTCKDTNIRVYTNVFITDIELSLNRVGYVADLTLSPDWKTYEKAKTLMHGSLLLFTHNDFQTVVSATVITSRKEKGKIIVDFGSVHPNDVFSTCYLMVESEVYFEPYHKVMKVLQKAVPPIPMQKYIVNVVNTVYPPAYLSLNSTYFYVNNMGQGREFKTFDVWPPAREFGLDKSQMDAYRFALTKEFVVIQGPPGTGKTYLGTKIAGTLLNSISFNGRPILVICGTNHALDQFLEGILKYTRAVVRLGGQSKSKILEDYNLNKLRQPKCLAAVYYDQKKKLDNIFKELSEATVKMEICNMSIVSLDTLRMYFIREFPHLVSHYGPFQSDSKFLEWLLGVKYNNEVQTHDLKISFSEIKAKDEVETLKKEIQQLRSLQYSANVETVIASKERSIVTLETAIATFKEMMASRHRTVKVPEFDNIYELNKTERWSLYFEMLKSTEKYFREKKIELYRDYMRITRELDELRDTADCEKLRDIKCVGMTTTMAAARHGLLQKLKSFVVIVEEAAEVMEAHILAALTNECQHLILIGDHQQLRPNSAHYIIGKKYGLEVSLFERMVKNGVQSKTLTVQRRMRQEIRDLLVPAIYKKLDCHPDVLVYPDVRGMDKNVCFYDHEHFEEVEENGSSYRNKFEADRCLALASYLMEQNYKPSEVTILATYSAQVALIVKLKEHYDGLEEVHVTTVDNFQGEESRIVVLSLVRSNAERNVGFLGTENRVCVALSRAKEGLYIFGNMSCLERKPLWNNIKSVLQTQNAIEQKLIKKKWKLMSYWL